MHTPDNRQTSVEHISFAGVFRIVSNSINKTILDATISENKKNDLQ